MNIKAGFDKVIVKPFEVENKVGSIILSATTTPPQSYGKVLSIGKDVKTDVKIGEVAIFARFAGQTIVVGKEEYRVLMDGEIYGVLENIESLNG